ncbi:MAG: histidine kinase dimerization/phospho-acceptor domain-containing protein [Nodosilinea sp.]
MPLPALAQFLAHPPSYPLTAGLADVALEQAETFPYRYIIVVDQQQRPLGAIAVGRLWAVDRAAIQASATAADAPTLGDCEPWLEPIVTLMAQATLADLWAMAPWSMPQPVVVVDAEMQYVGVIKRAALLGWLAGQVSFDPTEGAGVREVPTSIEGAGVREVPASISAQDRAWVVELSHALKSPLTSLLGLSTLLLDRRVGSLDERQLHYVTLMRQAIRKLMLLINQLLDWMRLEANQMTLDLAPVDLNDLASTLLPNFFRWLPEADPAPAWGQCFELALPPPSVELVADQLHLQQSLYGVLDYLLHHGAEPRGLVIAPWGRWLALTVWAPAPAGGIEKLPPTDQTDPLEDLGLSLARRLCHCHGGELTRLMSAVHGYRISLLLPLESEVAANPGALLLLASHSPGVIDQVYDSLQGSRYGLAVAHSYGEALAMRRRLTPAAVLVHGATLGVAPNQALADLGPAAETGPSELIFLGPTPELWELTPPVTLPIDRIAEQLLPTLNALLPPTQTPAPRREGLTLLLLLETPDSAGVAPSTGLRPWLQHYRCRLLQADDLDQASLLGRVWQPDAIILDRLAPLTVDYWQRLANCPDLSKPPVVTFMALPPALLKQPGGERLIACPAVLTQPSHRGAIALMRAIATANLLLT